MKGSWGKGSWGKGSDSGSGSWGGSSGGGGKGGGGGGKGSGGGGKGGDSGSWGGSNDSSWDWNASSWGKNNNSKGGSKGDKGSGKDAGGGKSGGKSDSKSKGSSWGGSSSSTSARSEPYGKGGSSKSSNDNQWGGSSSWGSSSWEGSSGGSGGSGGGYGKAQSSSSYGSWGSGGGSSGGKPASQDKSSSWKGGKDSSPGGKDKDKGKGKDGGKDAGKSSGKDSAKSSWSAPTEEKPAWKGAGKDSGKSKDNGKDAGKDSSKGKAKGKDSSGGGKDSSGGGKGWVSQAAEEKPTWKGASKDTAKEEGEKKEVAKGAGKVKGKGEAAPAAATSTTPAKAPSAPPAKKPGPREPTIAIRVDSLDRRANAAISRAQSLQESASEKVIDGVDKALDGAITGSNELLKMLAEAIEKATGDEKEELGKHKSRVETTLSNLTTESGKVKLAQEKAQAEEQARQKKETEKIMEEAEKLVTEVESMVKAAQEAHKPAAEASSDEVTEEIEAALKDTVEKAKEAHTKAVQAQGQLQKNINALKSFNQEVAKKANEDLTAFKERVRTGLVTVTPLREAAQDFKERAQIAQHLDEMTEATGKAEQATADLEEKAGKAPTKVEEDAKKVAEGIKEAKEAVAAGNQLIAELRKGGRPGGALSRGLQPHQDKLKPLGERIEKVKKLWASELLDQEVRDAVQQCKTLAEEIQASKEKAINSEMPFLTGLEVLPEAESGPVLEKCGIAEVNFRSAITKTEQFLKATKELIKKSSTKELVEATTKGMEELQKVLDPSSERLRLFSSEMKGRRTASQLQSANTLVAALEKMSAEVADVCKALDEAISSAAESDAVKTEVEKCRKFSADLQVKITEGTTLLKQITSTAGGKNNPHSSEISKLNSRIGAVKGKMKELNGKMWEGEKLVKGRVAEQALSKPKAAMEDVDAKMAEAKKLAESLTGANTEALLALDGPLKILEDVEKACKAVSDAIAEATKAITAAIEDESLKDTDPKSPLSAARTTITGMKKKAESQEWSLAGLLKKAKASLASIGSAQAKVIAAEIRKRMSEKSSTVDATFEEFAKKKKFMPADGFHKLVSSFSDLKISKDHEKLAFEELSIGDLGIAPWSFKRAVMLYYSCVKTVVMMSEFEHTKGEPVRKAQEGEVLELLEPEKRDENLRVTRLRCRALEDGKEGWLPKEGNQGTVYLKEVPKPYSHVLEETPMDDEKTPPPPPGDDEGEEAKETKGRTVKPGEVLEILEGPIKGEACKIKRVKIQRESDKKEGWITMKDQFGLSPVKEESCHYKVVSAAVITDVLNVKEAKMSKRLEPGDEVEGLGLPEKDSESNMMRVRVKAASGEEGYVSIHSTQSKLYLEESKKVLSATKVIPLQQAASANSAIQAQLAKGDKLIVKDGPQEITLQGVNRVKCKSLGSGEEGWLSIVSDNNLKPWTGVYRCVKEVPVLGSPDETAKEGEETKKMAQGETGEFIEGPRISEDGLVKLRLRLAKDGSTGWVSFATADGAKRLTVVPKAK